MWKWLKSFFGLSSEPEVMPVLEPVKKKTKKKKDSHPITVEEIKVDEVPVVKAKKPRKSKASVDKTPKSIKIESKD